MEVEDFLGEFLDADQMNGDLICLVFSSIAQILETSVHICGVSCGC